MITPLWALGLIVLGTLGTGLLIGAGFMSLLVSGSKPPTPEPKPAPGTAGYAFAGDGLYRVTGLPNAPVWTKQQDIPVKPEVSHYCTQGL